jgi:hypothetical protein
VDLFLYLFLDVRTDVFLEGVVLLADLGHSDQPLLVETIEPHLLVQQATLQIVIH